MTKRRPDRETAVSLTLWHANGQLSSGDNFKARRVSFPEVSVGRTASRRRLGFAMQGTAQAPGILDPDARLFTLDRVQVANLRDYLTRQLRRLKK